MVFLDDRACGSDFCGFPVMGKVEAYTDFRDKMFVIAIGSAQVREKIAEELKAVHWYTAIHPSAVISELDVTIDEGTVIMASAVVNPGARIGRHCIINTGAIIEHDNQIRELRTYFGRRKIGGNGDYRQSYLDRSRSCGQ